MKTANPPDIPACRDLQLTVGPAWCPAIACAYSEAAVCLTLLWFTVETDGLHTWSGLQAVASPKQPASVVNRQCGRRVPSLRQSGRSASASPSRKRPAAAPTGEVAATPFLQGRNATPAYSAAQPSHSGASLPGWPNKWQRLPRTAARSASR